MFCLRWEFPDGKREFCLGPPDTLATVKFAISQYWPDVKYRLTDVETGYEESCPWLKDSELIRYRGRL